MKTALVFLVTGLLALSLAACGGGTSKWQMGSSQDDQGNSIAVHSPESIYVAGTSNGVFNGDKHRGGSDVILVKFANVIAADPNKENMVAMKWARQIGSSKGDKGWGVAVDSAGNAYVTGNTNGNFDGNTNMGLSDIFIAKYDSAGNKVWSRQFGTAGPDYATDIAVDSAGNAYLTGFTAGALDGNPNFGLQDVIIVKYDTDGTRRWSRQIGTNAAEVGFGITVDSSSIYATGKTMGGIDGNTNFGMEDIFIVKFDMAGNKQWSRQIGSAGPDIGWDIAVDSAGCIVVTGETFDYNGKSDLITVKHDPNGTMRWTRQLGSAEEDSGKSIAVDSADNVYVAGSSEGDFDGNTNIGGSDIIAIKFDSAGTKQWSRQTGSAAIDTAHGIAVESGFLHLTGDTEGSIQGPQYSSFGGSDLFIWITPSEEE